MIVDYLSDIMKKEYIPMQRTAKRKRRRRAEMTAGSTGG